MKSIQPKKRSVFNVHDENGIKYIFQLRVGLSSLRAHKRNHKFKDTLMIDVTVVMELKQQNIFCSNALHTKRREQLYCLQSILSSLQQLLKTRQIILLKRCCTEMRNLTIVKIKLFLWPQSIS